MQAMKFFDPPPVRYMGSKWQLADWIIAQMPPHVTYVEPYCGSAAVFFRKEPSRIEVLNDLNNDVLNFFEMLRNRPDDLVRVIDLTPFSRAEYERAFESCSDTLERARRFYVRCYQAYGNGGIRRKTGWRHVITDNRGSTPSGDWSRLTGLLKAARRLKEAQIENRDALWVIEHYDTERTLFYIDPPYVLKSRKRAAKRYLHEMLDEEHRQLAEVLHRIRGMVILSGYKSPLYEELYPDWQVTTKTTTTNGNSTAVEYLWLSPNATEMSRWPLFGDRAGNTEENS